MDEYNQQNDYKVLRVVSNLFLLGFCILMFLKFLFD
jgi:hypothetical protein